MNDNRTKPLTVDEAFVSLDYGNASFVADRDFRAMCAEAGIEETPGAFAEAYDYVFVTPVRLVGGGEGWMCFG